MEGTLAQGHQAAYVKEMEGTLPMSQPTEAPAKIAKKALPMSQLAEAQDALLVPQPQAQAVNFQVVEAAEQEDVEELEKLQLPDPPDPAPRPRKR